MPHDNWRVSGVEFGSPNNNNLRSIAVGSGGVYVAEINGNNPTQILQFTEAGAYVRRFSTDFGYIHGIACDAAGNVYVLSRGLTRVRVFDANGTFVREWGQWGHGDSQFDLEGATGNTMIGVSSKTNEVFVCDPGNARVQVFSTTGTFIRKWGQAGSLPGQGVRGSAPSRWSPVGDCGFRQWTCDSGECQRGVRPGAQDFRCEWDLPPGNGLGMGGVQCVWTGGFQ